MRPYLVFILLSLFSPGFSAFAAVELCWEGKTPTRLEEVYHQHGVPYLAAEQVFSALGLHGKWDSVEHVYELKLPQGVAKFFPGGRYLYLDGTPLPLAQPARFLDETLRIPESFVTEVLPMVVHREIYYRNLDPPRPLQDQSDEEGGIDRLFALLLRRERLSTAGSGLTSVAIDPGHGGSDPGVIAPDGSKEKEVTLQLAEQLGKRLKMRFGIPVHLTRDGDYQVEQQERFALATRSDADLYLILHAQSSPVSERRGIMLFIRSRASAEGAPPARDESLQLAGALRESLMGEGWEVAPVRSAPLLPLGQGDLPTVLIEAGFLSNQQDLQILHDPVEQNRLAAAIENGLVTYAKRRQQESRK